MSTHSSIKPHVGPLINNNTRASFKYFMPTSTTKQNQYKFICTTEITLMSNDQVYQNVELMFVIMKRETI